MRKLQQIPKNSFFLFALKSYSNGSQARDRATVITATPTVWKINLASI
jgi:hypothetical protein